MVKIYNPQKYLTTIRLNDRTSKQGSQVIVLHITFMLFDTNDAQSTSIKPWRGVGRSLLFASSSDYKFWCFASYWGIEWSRLIFTVGNMKLKTKKVGLKQEILLSSMDLFLRLLCINN